MNKKILIIIIPLLFLLTGCYDYKELNSISILSATEINKIDDEFIVSAQAVNPQAPDKTSNAQAPFIIYTGRGKTIQEAYRSIANESSKFLYLNHIQILIINEKIAKENLDEIVDYFMRSSAIRTEFYVLIGRDDNILDIITPINDISSASIKESIENNLKYLGTTSDITFNELVSIMLDKNSEIVLPSIKLINDSKEGENIENTEETKVNTKYELSNLAIFKDDKLIGYLNEEQSKTYNILQNKINNTILTYECDKDKYMSVEIIDSQSSIDVSNKKANIEVKLSGNLNEYNCSKSLENKKTIEKIEKEFEQKLTESITKNINEVRTEYNSDIFGFLDNIYKKDYKTYKTIKNNWYSSNYQSLELSVNVDLTIIAKGKVMEAINEKNQ